MTQSSTKPAASEEEIMDEEPTASVNITISMKQYEVDRLKALAIWNSSKYQPYLKILLREAIRRAEAKMEAEKREGGYSAMQTWDPDKGDDVYTVRFKDRIISEGLTYDETYHKLAKMGLTHYTIIPTLVEAEVVRGR